MVQGLQAKAAAQAAVCGEGKAKVEAEWVDRSPQDRAEVVYARTAQQSSLMLPGSLVIQEVVQNVVRK
jgi:hypothetical protein